MTQERLQIAIGSDHAGFRYKEAIKAHLEAQGYAVRDFGTTSEASVDYPLYIHPVAQAVAAGACPLGIVLGGSGNGEAIVANKVQGVRCGVCWDEQTARLAKEHNDANMISIGQRTISQEMALKIVDAWLAAEFQGGRHARRVEQIRRIDAER